ncbi:EamA family transporter [Nonomuraea soli]|uniref:Drug/metabolite transporter (DMT)-like permease n=1 Tax=Nonomuraea soli TaxID=1032476 RepID=A0A7W0HTF1_9ACTN|nr:EamA family transporter [Nonomuraea soli]MBA2894877.1 drug/metabolite transporter (DMT)-like permease [Nonomuraea soli]
MIPLLLATLCALAYGASDFLGGLAARRTSVVTVVVAAQVAGLFVLAPLIGVLPGRPSWPALAWGAAAGLAGAFGVLVFYRALAGGRISVVAPASATLTAALPVVWGLGMGERPVPAALFGVALAVAAVALVSHDPSARGGRAWVGPICQAAAVGVGLGGFSVLIAQPPAQSGLWPLAGARLASIGLLVVLCLATGRNLRPNGPRATGAAVGAGVLDMAANVLFLLALRSDGLLSIVAVVSSLYPAGTLLLARYVLGERLRPVQLAGVLCALGAVSLIAVT